VTSSSGSRSGFDPPAEWRGPAGPEGATAAPPESAVPLSDLISDAGPLPPDAALECVQRLAERLTHTPAFSCGTLAPADVLIDDDGGVWLRQAPLKATGPLKAVPPEGMDRLGSLLAFLVTGDVRCVSENATAEALPVPLSTVAGRLFSRNGTCYASYAELARDAAILRGVAPAPHVEDAVRAGASEANQTRQASVDTADETKLASETSGTKLGATVAVILAVSAAVAFAIWQWL
jgi:hypothetical protein